MKSKLEGTYQIAKNAIVSVSYYEGDKRFLKISQSPICSCDNDRWFILQRRPLDKLIRYLQNDYEKTMVKLLLECPEVHHHGWNCKKPCWFRVNFPEVMEKVYKQLTKEKAYKIRNGYYQERFGEAEEQ